MTTGENVSNNLHNSTLASGIVGSSHSFKRDGKTSTIKPLSGCVRGSVKVPGDKSISHRAVLLSAMAEGTTRLSGVLDSLDVRSTIDAVSALGAKVNLTKQADGSLAGGITGWGKAGPVQPNGPIDCGNSGTTARLLLGVLSPWNIEVELTGDASLQARPMRRITAPLMKMGAQFSPSGKETLPITVHGGKLDAIEYETPAPSAQLKTAVLLAGIYANGTTTVNEPAESRNHTELMLPQFGVNTTAAARTASVTGPAELKACEISVPGDPSSAAYIAAAAILKRGSAVQIEDVSLNTARIGFTRTLERMGADISVSRTTNAGKEPVGMVQACYTPTLRGCEIPADKIVTIIDEIPLLALCAAFAHGVTVFRKVTELRFKECNRIEAIMEGLHKLDIEAWCHGDDLFVEGCPNLQVPSGITFDSHGDHRLAMTWGLLGLIGNTSVNVKDFSSISVSFPTFIDTFTRLFK